MNEWLDRIASIGAIITAFALSCCLPLFALAGASLGLTFLQSESPVIPIILQSLYVLALIGGFATFRKHRKITPLLFITSGNLVIFYAYYFQFSPLYIYVALASLVLGSVLNYFANKKCRCTQKDNG